MTTANKSIPSLAQTPTEMKKEKGPKKTPKWAKPILIAVLNASERIEKKILTG